jgi:hypothetical protein
VALVNGAPTVFGVAATRGGETAVFGVGVTGDRKSVV